MFWRVDSVLTFLCDKPISASNTPSRLFNVSIVLKPAIVFSASMMFSQSAPSTIRAAYPFAGRWPAALEFMANQRSKNATRSAAGCTRLNCVLKDGTLLLLIVPYILPCLKYCAFG